MTHCTILLDGKGVDKTLDSIICSAKHLATVDRGLGVAYRLEKVPEVAFLGPSTKDDQSRDWVGFSGGRVIDYGMGNGSDGFVQALEWALEAGAFDGIDLLSPFSGDPLADHGRLISVAQHSVHGIPIQILESHHRWILIDGEFTLNAKPGTKFSLLPVSEISVDIAIKSGVRDITHKGLTSGTTALFDIKTQHDVTSIIVSEGRVIARLPR